jgi:hypothetical protein
MQHLNTIQNLLPQNNQTNPYTTDQIITNITNYMNNNYKTISVSDNQITFAIYYYALINNVTSGKIITIYNNLYTIDTKKNNPSIFVQAVNCYNTQK